MGSTMHFSPIYVLIKYCYCATSVHLLCTSSVTPPTCHMRLQVFIKVSHLNLTLLVDYVG